MDSEDDNDDFEEVRKRVKKKNKRVRRKRNGPHDGAKTGLIFSIVGLLCCVIGSIVGVIQCHGALKDIDRDPQRYTNRGSAIGGLVVGYIGLAIYGMAIFAQIILAAAG